MDRAPSTQVPRWLGMAGPGQRDLLSTGQQASPGAPFPLGFEKLLRVRERESWAVADQAAAPPLHPRVSASDQSWRPGSCWHHRRLQKPQATQKPHSRN